MPQIHSNGQTTDMNISSHPLRHIWLSIFVACYCLLVFLYAERNLGSQELAPGEPILGDMLPPIAPVASNSAAADGQLQVYQILQVQLGSAQPYQAVELQLEPAVVAFQNPNNSEASEGISQPVSLLVYHSVRNIRYAGGSIAREDNANILYQGKRLWTRGLSGKSKIHFILTEVGQNPAADSSISSAGPQPESHYSLNGKVLNIPVAVSDFPIYIVLYPFQRSTAALTLDSRPNVDSKRDPVANSGAGYHYQLRFIRKDYGFVRFHLQLSTRQPGGQSASHYLDDPNLFLSIQIDENDHEWIFDPDFPSGQNGDPAERGRYSKNYRLGLGPHKVQISSPRYYARARFQTEAGAQQLVELRLKERLGRLQLTLPKDAMLLLDGIPLQDQQHLTPVWQDVEIREPDNYHYQQPRLQYRLTVPTGRHHVLIQYEGNTWQREIYIEEGMEQYFELDWALRSQYSSSQP